jgi:hypothetical protein
MGTSWVYKEIEFIGSAQAPGAVWKRTGAASFYLTDQKMLSVSSEYPNCVVTQDMEHVEKNHCFIGCFIFYIVLLGSKELSGRKLYYMLWNWKMQYVLGVWIYQKKGYKY